MKQLKSLLVLAVVLFAFQSVMAGGYKIGSIAADFSLKNVDGKMVSMSDYPSAQGFIVVFTCNHCPYAKAYEDRVIALDAKYKPLGYPVIAINSNDPVMEPKDSYEAMQVRAKEKKFTFPYLFDEGQKIYPVFGAVRTPHVFVLQRANTGLVVQYIGAIDNNYKDASDATEKYVEDAVNSLIKGKTVKKPETVAIGCTIKAKK